MSPAPVPLISRAETLCTLALFILLGRALMVEKRHISPSPSGLTHEARFLVIHPTPYRACPRHGTSSVAALGFVSAGLLRFEATSLLDQARSQAMGNAANSSRLAANSLHFSTA
jgi:hypothetical protein